MANGNGFTIQRAKKTESFLRMSIAGVAKSGKTFTSLAIAKHLLGEAYICDNTDIVVIDTERKSSLKYADIFTFDLIPLEDYSPENYIACINVAIEAGKKIAILDSFSHAWFGKNGILEFVDEKAATMKTQNTFAAWKDGTKKYNTLIDCVTGAPIHIIATMRSKQEYVITENDRGKKDIKKVGLAPVQRDGIEYEFDVPADMDVEHRMIIGNSRCHELDGKSFVKPGKEVADILRRWLSGAVAEPDATKIARIEKALEVFKLHGAESKYNEIIVKYGNAKTPKEIAANRVDAVLAKIKEEYDFIKSALDKEKAEAAIEKPKTAPPAVSHQPKDGFVETLFDEEVSRATSKIEKDVHDSVSA